MGDTNGTLLLCSGSQGHCYYKEGTKWAFLLHQGKYYCVNAPKGALLLCETQVEKLSLYEEQSGHYIL